jgi:hypothetical protein
MVLPGVGQSGTGVPVASSIAHANLSPPCHHARDRLRRGYQRVRGSSGGGDPAPDLEARFSYDVETELVNVTSCPATAVLLRDRSTGSPTAWRWEFGDGRTSTERNPIGMPPVSRGDMVTLTVSRGDESASTAEQVNNYPEC